MHPAAQLEGFPTKMRRHKMNTLKKFAQNLDDKHSVREEKESNPGLVGVSPRRAKKYVFFNAATGAIVFEWGGIQLPMVCKGKESEDQTVDIYDLGILVKEVKREGSALSFIFAGDIMDPQMKRN